MAKAKIKTASEGTQEVNDYMKMLEHPLNNEIELVRTIILESDPNILEQVKWNAPSFRYMQQDFVTFNVRPLDKIHLVFHHPSIVQITSDLLEGDYKDRRMLYLDRAKIVAARSELTRIVRQSVKLIAGEI